MIRSSALAVLAAVSACAPPVRTAPSPVERAAKEFRATPGMTTVYVFRDAQQFETGMSDGERMSLELDGDPLGVTIARTFLVTVVSAGPHELVSIADNRSALRFDGRPDEIVYVYQDARYVVSRTTRLERVDAASAQRRIQRCYLVPAAPPHAAPRSLPTRPPGS